jgi:hypothetical protein
MAQSDRQIDSAESPVQRRWMGFSAPTPYRLVFETMVPKATLVADPFHVVKVAPLPRSYSCTRRDR